MSAGQYILTSSAVPRNAQLHSGAGRIVRLHLRPFSLAERGLTKQTITLSSLLEEKSKIKSQHIDVSQHVYVEEILKSGFPGIRTIPDEYRKDMLDGYIDNIVEKEFPEQGAQVRRPETLRAWLKAYAAAEGSTASYESIMGAATLGQDKKPAKATTMVYRDVLASLWITDPVLPWTSEGNIYRNLGKTPKHYLVDPALTARLLGITEKTLLAGKEVRILGSQRKTAIGRLFESLVAQSLKVYTDAIGAQLSHLRTVRGDHEVDFIVEKDDALIALEVKFSPLVKEEDVKQINWFEGVVQDRHIVKAVVYTGQYLTKRETDGVLLIPAACLEM